MDENKTDADGIVTQSIKKASIRAISEWGCKQTGWNPVSMDEAAKIAEGKSVDELDNMTGVRSSVEAAFAGIKSWQEKEKHSRQIEKDRYTGTSYNLMIAYTRNAVHNDWMKQNVNKFFDPKREDRMFQFLPALALPLEEVKKDDIFIRDIFEAITGEKWEDHIMAADEYHQNNGNSIPEYAMSDNGLKWLAESAPKEVREALQNKEVKQKMRDSIISTFNLTNGDMIKEDVKDMEYLEETPDDTINRIMKQRSENSKDGGSDGKTTKSQGHDEHDDGAK